MEQGKLSNVEWLRGIGEYKIDWGPGQGGIIMGSTRRI